MTPLEDKLESAHSLSPKRRRALLDLLLFVADRGPATTKTIAAALDTIPGIPDLIAAGFDAKILQRDRANNLDKLGRGRPVYQYSVDVSITKAQIEAALGHPDPKPQATIEVVGDRAGIDDQQLLRVLTEMSQQLKGLDLRVRQLELINQLYEASRGDQGSYDRVDPA